MIIIADAFSKKTQKTPSPVIETMPRPTEAL
jgi:hypothetical protein